MNPNPRTPSDYAVTSIKIERGQLDAFKKVARANHRSVSQELRRLIDQRIAEHDEAGMEKAA